MSSETVQLCAWIFAQLRAPDPAARSRGFGRCSLFRNFFSPTRTRVTDNKVEKECRIAARYKNLASRIACNLIYLTAKSEK